MHTEAARSDFSRDVYCLLGMPVDAVDFAGAEQRVRSAAERRSPCFLSTPNVNFLVTCQSDEAFRDALLDSDLSVVDGMPLVWLGRLVGIPLRERVAGSSLFEALRHGGGKRLSVFFLGGEEGDGAQAMRQLEMENLGLACVGHFAPGYGSVEDMSGDELIQRINASNADVLVVSLGARKGQVWIDRNRRRLNVPVISALGAVLHFAAGTVKRAPVWMQNAGLEWLWRIKEQPELWRRYFHDGLHLARLLVTRVLPQAWYLRRHSATPALLAGARLDISEQGAVHVIRLRGAWTQANSPRLRRAFHHAALCGKDVRLDLEELTHIDSAFVGLAMLLHVHLRRQRRRLLLAGAPKAVRRFIDRSGAGFLHSSAAAATQRDGVDEAELSDPVQPS